MLADCGLLLLLLLTRSVEATHTAEAGQNAHLPCSYALATAGKPVPVCWGRGPCPTFSCTYQVLTTDERSVSYQKSSRYQLKGAVHRGDVSLTILNVTLADSGIYCCRVQIPGPMNDEKFNLELVIQPARVIPAPTEVLPRVPVTEEHGSAETQTLATLHDKNQTQIHPLARNHQDSEATTRMGIYVGVGVPAGLALALLLVALILTWYSHRKRNLQSLSLITLANLPPSGLTNAAAERMRSEENIYTIEENAYEMEDPYYCYVSNGRRS
ncbi:hepatitis A virus cellular receptor 2 [Perognathus longimembris pacificus]|uniref:hepatitis A virus cellular receptor 2 n=1 Tax=Perognathus longimembris pacificus TaxID=214514 RepID=UPI0020192B6F|nr:hepatitis A virus cellular receptor 2 [Perognathus longimembris pacificus]